MKKFASYILSGIVYKVRNSLAETLIPGLTGLYIKQRKTEETE